MQKGTRCNKACEPCRKRKERCIGGVPCVQCTRRKRTTHCQYAPGVVEQTHKQRKNTIDCLPAETTVHVPRITEQLRINGEESTVVVGDSSTLGLLSFVRKVGNSLVNDTETGLHGNADMLEPELAECQVDAHTLLSNMTTDDIQTYAQSYIDFVHGIFDIFSEADLFEDLAKWSPIKSSFNNVRHASTSALLFVLAIGAEQNGNTGLSYALFVTGYKQVSIDLMEPPTLTLVQALIVLVLYLLLKCRRNSAFVFLGSAIQASHTIGLHDYHVNKPTAARERAWKCLRILDVSSCASLGRSISTIDVNRYTESYTTTSSSIDLAGLRLCSIAEMILRTVYAERSLTIQFALSASEELKNWAENIPGVLVGAGTHSDLPDKPLRQQICANHMTAAYYWTIMLLTRPFLMNDILSRTSRQERERGGAPLSTFVDACIDSAIRCLEATIVLLKYQDLPPKLFLVVNTTLTSALVLILAIFGGYDETLPVDQALDHAEIFLKHLSNGDIQAAQYLEFVQAQRRVASEYCKKRAGVEMDRRGAQVCAMFGAIRSTQSVNGILNDRDVSETSRMQDWAESSCVPNHLVPFEGSWSSSFLDYMGSASELADMIDNEYTERNLAV